MRQREWAYVLCSMFKLVKPTKYHLDIVFTTSSSPLSFTNHTILCGYTTDHCTYAGWNFSFSSLFLLAFSLSRSYFPLHFPLGIQGIKYSSQIYLLYAFNVLTAFRRRKYGIHFIVTWFFFTAGALASATIAAVDMIFILKLAGRKPYITNMWKFFIACDF